MRSVSLSLALALAFLVPAQAQEVVAENAFPGTVFREPVELVVAPGQNDRVYVVEQGISGPAQVRTLGLGGGSPTVFLDLSGRVLAGGEQGLLGLAFHPGYAENGRLFVYYTAASPRRSVLAEFTRSASDPLAADPASARVLLEVPQPFDNHNGGKIAFGPDGHLYVALGDGGSGGDPQNQAQNRTTLLGTVARLDVDAPPGEGLEYAIPTDNPFVGNTEGWREEIYAFGLRNPWKFSFDGETGDLWLGDVGQGRREEINLVRAGGNYGWRVVEGDLCFNPSSGCDLLAYDAPVFTYAHGNGPGNGQSVTGGFVYRGTALPALVGRYLYADFVNPRVWALAYDAETGAAESTLLLNTIPNVSALVEGPDREAYVVSYGGTVSRLRAAAVSAEGESALSGSALVLAGANPFQEEARLEVVAGEAGPHRLTIHDALGREVAVLLDGGLAVGERRATTFAAEGFAPGVYLARLEAPDGVRVQRLVRVQ